jgi:hypothetical protein
MGGGLGGGSNANSQASLNIKTPLIRKKGLKFENSMTASPMSKAINRSPPAHSTTLSKNHQVKLQSTRIDPTRFMRPNAGAVSKLTMAHDGQVIDDNYLN